MKARKGATHFLMKRALHDPALARTTVASKIKIGKICSKRASCAHPPDQGWPIPLQRVITQPSPKTAQPAPQASELEAALKSSRDAAHLSSSSSAGQSASPQSVSPYSTLGGTW
jgi:hypothetical protein